MLRLTKIRFVTAAFLLAFSFAPALAGDVVLENLTINEDKGVLRIARVEALNTNLSSDEIRRLLDTSADGKEALAMLMRFSADKFAISGASFSGDEGTMIFAPILATGIQKGRLERLICAGVDVDLKNIEGAGAVSVKFKALEMEKADFAPLMSALTRGDAEIAGFRAERLVWGGFEASVPDADLSANAAGGNRIRVSLGKLISTNQYAGDTLVRSVGEIGNLVIELPPASEGGRTLAGLGYSKLDLSMSGEARYDAATRALVLENYILKGIQAGQLRLSGKFGNVDPALLGMAVPNEKLAALFLANVSELEIRFVNEGLVDNGFAFAAVQQGKSAAALRAETSALAVQFLPMLLGGDPSSLPLAQSVQTFLKDSKNFTLTLKSRGAPLPLGRLSAIGDPATFLALVEVTLKSNQ
jgi:hypothetical protein